MEQHVRSLRASGSRDVDKSREKLQPNRKEEELKSDDDSYYSAILATYEAKWCCERSNSKYCVPREGCGNSSVHLANSLLRSSLPSSLPPYLPPSSIHRPKGYTCWPFGSAAGYRTDEVDGKPAQHAAFHPRGWDMTLTWLSRSVSNNRKKNISAEILAEPLLCQRPPDPVPPNRLVLQERGPFLTGCLKGQGESWHEEGRSFCPCRIIKDDTGALLLSDTVIFKAASVSSLDRGWN